jgi:predicted DCC family thiol-disulfide oxidoreductase YuxK
METKPQTAVLYNAGCPVCAREVGQYKAICRNADLPLRFDDIASAPAWGLTPDLAARRFHVLHKGQLLSGVPAFLALWQVLPGYSLLARCVALPGVRQAACFTYDHILAPALYRWHRFRQHKR